MKKLILFAVLVSLLAACGNHPDGARLPVRAPEDSIRAAIQAHLAHRGNLNLQAFETEVKQVTIDRDHATAEVEFRVKGGPGAMELSYALQKQDGVWSVIESDPLGSNFSHPSLDPTQNSSPNDVTAVPHSLADTLRSFKVEGGGASPLPPGHPALDRSR